MKLTVACIQMDIVFGNPEENFEKAERLIREAAEKKPDIILLPELWTTGYDLSRLNVLADEHASKSTAFLQEAAKKYGIHFVGGSVANQTKEGIFNTLLIVDKHGNKVHEYSKLHLFKLMDEHLYLTAGHSKGLFQLENRNYAGMICYDIRFPEWIRTHTARGAEALFVVAEWPLARLDHWRALLMARAIENQCFVIACNRSGSDPNNKFAGHSIIIDPWGEIIAEAGVEEEILAGEVDLDQTERVRKMIPVFEDRLPDYYK